MLGILPIFAGLLACMPEWVPLGDPEKSRIDPELTGIWHVGNSEEPLLGQFMFFQPWDKRTWLVTNVAFEVDTNEEICDCDLSDYEQLIEFIEDENFDEEDFGIAAISYKGWLAKVGGERFLMLEWRGLPNDSGKEITYDPFWLMDLRVDKTGDGKVELQLIDPEFEPLSDAPKTRRGWEKVVRKHIDNPELYSEEKVLLRRVEKDDEETVGALMMYAVIRESW